MSDKELLELAAKAAGIRLRRYEAETANITAYFVIEVTKDTHGDIWNPLTDDGDALRLAMRLGIDIAFKGSPDIVWADDNWSEPAGTDMAAATRRAITRAAAEIGRNMQ